MKSGIFTAVISYHDDFTVCAVKYAFHYEKYWKFRKSM